MFNLFVIKGCPYCQHAIELAKQHKITHKLHWVKPENKDTYKNKHNMNTFPQILYGSKTMIGGSDDFEQLIDSLSYLKNNFTNTTISNMIKNIKG